jgi:hypothetical protein
MVHAKLNSNQHLHRYREKPQQGWYKCNIDAGFHRELNKTTTGWCLRDHMALLEAMKAMEQRRISNVIFETNAKSVVDAIQFFHEGNSEFSLLVAHINNLLLSGQNFVVKFIMD